MLNNVILQDFIHAMNAAGIAPANPTQVHATGKIARYQIEGDSKGSKNGWYVLHTEQPVWGSFGSWKLDIKESWHENSQKTYTPAEKEAWRKQRLAQKTDFEAAQVAIHKECREKSAYLWESADHANPNHPYLVKKHVKPHGIKQTHANEKYPNPALIVPIHDMDAVLHGLVLIQENGDKRYITGSDKKGRFHIIGTIQDLDDDHIYICEGYATGASIHEATRKTVYVAFDAGNLIHVTKALRKKYPRAELIIAADNDTHLEPNKGKIKAQEAVDQCHGIMALPMRIDGRKCDWNDFHIENGLEKTRDALQDCLKIAKGKIDPRVLETPESLQQNDSEKPYPLKSLPPDLCAAITAIQHVTQAPLSMVATCALSVLSVATQGVSDAKQGNGTVTPCLLYTMIVAGSGERKSTVEKILSRAIANHQDKLAAELESKVKESRASLAAWNAEYNGILKGIENAAKKDHQSVDIPVLKQNLIQLELEKPRLVYVPKLILTDETTENLTWRLTNKQVCAAIMTSEGGAYLGSYSMSQDKGMNTQAQLNANWSGEEFNIGRKGEEFDRNTKGTRLTIALQVQPEALKEYIENSGKIARGTGFFARFLLANPESTCGTRFIEAGKDIPVYIPELYRFESRMTALLEKPYVLNQYGRLELQTVPLMQKAKVIWGEYFNKIESKLGKFGELADIKDIASKTADNAARLATMFALFEESNVVTDDHMIAACQLAEWHLNESRRFFEGAQVRLADQNATKLDQWLIQYANDNGVDEIPTKIVLQSAPYALRNKESFMAALEVLSDHNRAWLVTHGRKKSVRIHPNHPDLAI